MGSSDTKRSRDERWYSNASRLKGVFWRLWKDWRMPEWQRLRIGRRSAVLEWINSYGPVDPSLISWPDVDGKRHTLAERNTESIRSMEMANQYHVQPKLEPEPEPKVKLANVHTRNDRRLEELLEEYIRNSEKTVDKSEESK